MSLTNIVLTGFMGTGKTTIGRLVASQSGRSFVDTDELIAERDGRSIAAIFKEDGESAFRKMEATLAHELSGHQELVISTGGRLMLDPLNALLLSENGIVCCLTARPLEILARLAADGVRRPLLEVPDPEKRVEELMTQRADAYGQFHQISSSDKTAQLVSLEVLEAADKNIPGSSPLTSHLPVCHPGGKYQVVVGRELLSKVAQQAGLEGPVVVITDSNVGPLHAGRLANLNPLAVLTVPAGEGSKNLHTVSLLYEQLLDAGLDRSGTVIALGGGVVGDIAGFVGATFMRGVRFVQCPTTVLAMVDASVGGKTGVDLPQGKNLVGAFKQPAVVLADLDTLSTLPPADFTAGLAEIVKAGLIASPALLRRLQSFHQQLATSYQPPTTKLQSLIVESILIKRDVVEADPFESGRRKILNLGHTFAHAIEQVSGYAVRHGEAVAIGLVAAARLSAALGYGDGSLGTQIESILSTLNLPISIPADLPRTALIEAMSKDKKNEAGRLNFVLIREIRDVFVSDQVPETTVRDVLTSLQDN